MKGRILILVAFISLVLVAALALAHGGEQHIIGTVAVLGPNSITVKTTSNKTITVAVAADTKFLKDKAFARLADLNVGDRVVIHANEPVEGKFVAVTVEFASSKPIVKPNSTVPKTALIRPSETA
jgi:hypothetical protein